LHDAWYTMHKYDVYIAVCTQVWQYLRIGRYQFMKLVSRARLFSFIPLLLPRCPAFSILEQPVNGSCLTLLDSLCTASAHLPLYNKSHIAVAISAVSLNIVNSYIMGPLPRASHDLHLLDANTFQNSVFYIVLCLWDGGFARNISRRSSLIFVGREGKMEKKSYGRLQLH
jgi:hypothetical protein